MMINMLLQSNVMMSITLLVSFCILSGATNSPTITVPPLPTTATLYTPVDFTCEGEGHGDLRVTWTVNSGSITNTVKHERAVTSITANTSNGTISSVLTIISLPVNDGINIGCAIGTDFSNFAQSPSAPLTIRGISPVESVSLYLNSSMLYWSPPSSIPSQYQPLLSYIVNITIGTNGPVNVYTTNNTSLQLPSLTVCDVVNATITVTSGNYSSGDIIIIDEYNDCKYTTISKPRISYNITHGYFDVNFNITIVCIVLCKNTFIQGNLTPIQNYPKIPIDTNNAMANSTVRYRVPVITDTPQSYNFSAKVFNSIDKEIKLQSNSIHFTTYHVQDVSVYQVDDSVRVECTFVYQSIADGCHIKLTTDGSITQSFNISLINESNIASQYITLSVNGIYSIAAYDIVNGIITDIPSVQYDDIFQYMSLMDLVTTSDTTLSSTSINIFPSMSTELVTFTLPSTSPILTDSSSTHAIILTVGFAIGVGLFILIAVLLIVSRFRKRKRVEVNGERIFDRPRCRNNEYSEVMPTLVSAQTSPVSDNEFIPSASAHHDDVNDNVEYSQVVLPSVNEHTSYAFTSDNEFRPNARAHHDRVEYSQVLLPSVNEQTSSVVFIASDNEIRKNSVQVDYITIDHNNPQSRPIPPLPAEPVAVHNAVIHTSTNPYYDDVILSSPNVTPNDAYGVIYIKT